MTQACVWPGCVKPSIMLRSLLLAFSKQMLREGNEMIKRTLIAIALVALLATSAQAALEEYHHGYDPGTGDWDGKSGAVKVDGKEIGRASCRERV